MLPIELAKLVPASTSWQIAGKAANNQQIVTCPSRCQRMAPQGVVRIRTASERLGHASVGITLDTYSHVLPTMQSDAVRAFDELFQNLF